MSEVTRVFIQFAHKPADYVMQAHKIIRKWSEQPFDGGAEYVLFTPLPVETTGWQVIASAPRDGTPIDLWGINHLHYKKAGERIVKVVRGWREVPIPVV